MKEVRLYISDFIGHPLLLRGISFGIADWSLDEKSEFFYQLSRLATNRIQKKVRS